MDAAHVLEALAVYSVEQGYRKERGGTRQTPGIPHLIVCLTGKGMTFTRRSTAICRDGHGAA